MVKAPVLRQLLMDRESLEKYFQGDPPSFSDISRQMFLHERSSNVKLPDHYYQTAQAYSLSNINCLSQLLSKGLKQLSSEFLEVKNSLIYVKANCFSEWQDLLTFIPPLLNLSAKIADNITIPILGLSSNELVTFTKKYIEPNIVHTALPFPYFPQLEEFVNKHGLYDLHMHLNGSTETDIAWQFYLKYPDKISKELDLAFLNEKVKEQYEQEEFCFNPKQFYDRLKVAQRIRRAMVHILFKGSYSPELSVFNDLDFNIFFTNNVFLDNRLPLSFKHPMYEIFRVTALKESNWSDLCLECLLYVMIIDSLSRIENKALAELFHCYLLILGSVNRFLVQQVHQVGFDQFQKITLNGMRETPEKAYYKRFRQINGNQCRNLALIEARFSPKDNITDLARLIDSITKGWDKFKDEILEQKIQTINKHTSRLSYKETKDSIQPHLKLVAHFIKKGDKLANGPAYSRKIRHRALRLDIYKRAWALSGLIRYKKYKKIINGIDAAANELDAPPEVFAPVYRMLRQRGFSHFTYHVGEDFHHLVGGLRAIFEAVEFLDLGIGDRIGHATAVGISPKFWLNSVDSEMYIKQGEWLDDLIFASFLIRNFNVSELHPLIPRINNQIIELADSIYTSPKHSVNQLIDAWQIRKFCPFHLLNLDDFQICSEQPVWNSYEYKLCMKNKPSQEINELYYQYHQVAARKRYDKIIKIKTSELFTSSALKILQDIIHVLLHQKEIIIETLPTSNVRISFYNNYSDHHLWRWMGYGETNEGIYTSPPVIVGTDDPGIFATNIYNEYAHIYDNLVNGLKLTHHEAMKKIEKLHQDSSVYKF
jgi:adenosine deaminase